MQDFQKETIDGSLARVAVLGLHDSRSFHPALEIALQLAGDKRVAVIDAAYKASKKYATVYDFDAVHLESHHPDEFVKFIQRAESRGYGAILINDLSLAWDSPKSGVLALQRQKGGNYRQWKDVDPFHKNLVHALKGCSIHLVVTMRAKEKHKQTKNNEVESLGVHPIQRDDLADVFEIVGLYKNESLNFTRMNSCNKLKNQTFKPPYAVPAQFISDWLRAGNKLTPEAEAHQKRLLDLQEYASDYGIVGERLRAAGLATPGVQTDDPRFWTAEKCELIKRYISSGGVFGGGEQAVASAEAAH